MAESLGTVTALSFGASPAAPSSHQAPSSISFVSCCCSRSLAAIAPHAPRQLLPPPRGLWPLQKPPQCPAWCLLGLGPLLAPLQCHQEQFSGRERARRLPPGHGAGLRRSREMVQFYCTGANRTEDGTILVSLALPCSAVGALGGFFLLVHFSFVLCFFPARAGVTPSSPLDSSCQPPLLVARQHLV